MSNTTLIGCVQVLSSDSRQLESFGRIGSGVMPPMTSSIVSWLGVVMTNDSILFHRTFWVFFFQGQARQFVIHSAVFCVFTGDSKLQVRLEPAILNSDQCTPVQPIEAKQSQLSDKHGTAADARCSCQPSRCGRGDFALFHCTMRTHNHIAKQ